MFTFFLTLIYFTTLGLITLFERKILGLLQSRISNYRFSIFGLLQFFIDFTKLVGKSSLQQSCNKIAKQVLQSIVFLSFSVLNFLVISFLISYKSFNSFYLFFILFLLFINSVIKISSISFLLNTYNVNFLFKIKVIIIFLDSVIMILDFLFFMFLFEQDLVETLIFNSSHSLFFILLFLFFSVSIFKSFRSPFDYLERESESVNSFFIDSSSIEYSLWTLLEYTSVLNNAIYFLYVFKISISLQFLTCFLMFLLSVFIICFIRGVLIRFRIDLILTFILMLDLITFILILLLFIL